jgi:hypothetical protein
MSSPNENACHCPDRPIVEGPDQRPQNPPPYCVAEPNHPPPPNPPPPKKPHWGATCLTCVGMRSLAYRRCRSRGSPKAGKRIVIQRVAMTEDSPPNRIGRAALLARRPGLWAGRPRLSSRPRFSVRGVRSNAFDCTDAVREGAVCGGPGARGAVPKPPVAATHSGARQPDLRV